MSFLRKLFGKEEPPPPSEHAVIVYFQYHSTDLQPIFTLEDELEAAIQKASAGEFDGNEVPVNGGEASLYMYGPDGDALFAAVKPALETSDLMKGARVQIRYGPPEDGVRESEVFL